MIPSQLFSATTIPVLEQVTNFTEARHNVLAGNIANLDTPGYRTRDLSPTEFNDRLKDAIQKRDRGQTSPGYATLPGNIAGPQGDPVEQVSERFDRILYHDESNVSLEEQVLQVSKNQIKHNTAITIMISQFRLLQAAISERA